MRILLLGATGGTGMGSIRQAVERRWAVTAIVRSPERLGTLAPYVKVAPGSAFDPQAIADAADGCDAVLSTIGSSAGFLGRGSTSVCSDAAAALVAGMQQAGVDRLVFCTSAGVEPRDPGEVLPYRFIIKPFLQRTYDDMTVAETIIRSSALDWTLVRPARLTNRPGRSDYRASARFRPPGGTAIPRADVAAFMLDQVADPTWRHATPTLTT